jgi:outer membrane protein assembly factor BamA
MSGLLVPRDDHTVDDDTDDDDGFVEVAITEDIRARPVRVRGIKIVGAERTRVSTIEHELLAAFDATNLGQLVQSISAAQASFESLGIFKSLHIHVGSTEQPGVAELFVVVEEVGVPTMRVQLSQEGSGGAALETAGSLRSPLGFAEVIDFDATINAGGTQNFRVALRQPHAFNWRATTSVEVFRRMASMVHTSGCSLLSTGVRVGLQGDASRHKWVFELAKRDVLPQPERPHSTFMHTSHEVLRQSMDPSFKVSLQHTLRWATEATTTITTTTRPPASSSQSQTQQTEEGAARRAHVAAQVTTEVAGLAGGDVGFFKSLVDVTATTLLTGPYWGGRGLECCTRLLGGALLPLGEAGRCVVVVGSTDTCR